tara:strand:- start:98 stop:349 length:252 start_codon:yes stop_codon:yes gene_type:complete
MNSEGIQVCLLLLHRVVRCIFSFEDLPKRPLYFPNLLQTNLFVLTEKSKKSNFYKALCLRSAFIAFFHRSKKTFAEKYCFRVF